jgi:glycosyltransferase involved in cell wall biosynthesis
MNKKLCVVSCPIDTFSGYGARSRDFVRSLIKLKEDKWDIKILSQPWGNTSWGFLNPEKDSDLVSRIIDKMSVKPYIWFQITVPNEFQPIGVFNIGVTAGIETTICPPEWIEGCNKMNLIITSSKHSKDLFEKINFNITNEQGQTSQILKINTPVEILFEGFDTKKYGFIESNNMLPSVNEMLSQVEEKFAFLMVGHWLPGDIGEDRKNIGLTIRAFLETFKNVSNPPALVIKTSFGTNSYLDQSEVRKRLYTIKKDIIKNIDKKPNIYMIHGELTDEEMNHLYNHPKIKAHINLTKGEGFGRPLLEASLSKKPIIASNWSGHLDFLKAKSTVLVDGKLTKVHPSAVREQGIMKEAEWFSFDYNKAKDAMKNVFNNIIIYNKKAVEQYVYSKNNFTLEQMTFAFDKILEKHLNLPEVVQLKLPQLKKIELPKLTKL